MRPLEKDLLRLGNRSSAGRGGMESVTRMLLMISRFVLRSQTGAKILNANEAVLDLQVVTCRRRHVMMMTSFLLQMTSIILH